jgi:hypothetical protein
MMTRMVGFILRGDWNARKIALSTGHYNDQSRPKNSDTQCLWGFVISPTK